MKHLFPVLLTVLIVFSCSGQKPEQRQVRHIILWTLRDDITEVQKQELLKSAEEDIRDLEKTVPGTVSMKMLYKGRLDSSNCDFMFDFVFESEEALDAFSTNPAHLESAAKLKPYIAGRACLDILK